MSCQVQGSPEDTTNFRPIRESDIDTVVEFIRQQNWFILRRNTMDIIYKDKVADFFAITDKKDDEKVLGIASLCNTRDKQVVLGVLIIREEFRGQGLGTYLLKKVISLREDVTVNWISAADPFYIKLGYTKSHQSACLVELEMHRDKVDKYCIENPTLGGVEITFLSADRMEDLVQYDAGAKGYEARKLMSMVVRIADKVAVAIAGNDQRIVGYTAICKEDAGNLHFNGFYADGKTIAAALLK